MMSLLTVLNYSLFNVEFSILLQDLFPQRNYTVNRMENQAAARNTQNVD